MPPGKLLAVSDLHVSYPQNRRWVEDLPPGSPGDWLLVVGDVAEKVADIERTLRTLADRFGTVVWVPGNYDLWSHPADPVKLRGEERYRHLVALCRDLGVTTPEDPYPVWPGPGGPAVIVPLFLLYDYTFRPDGASTKAEAPALAYQTGVAGTDERMLHPDPYPSREAWCQARIAATTPRPCSPSGAAPSRPPTGTCGTALSPWSTATCTSPGPPGRTAYASKRCRSATRRSRRSTRAARGG